MDGSLQELSAADPARGLEDDVTSPLVRQMAVDARDAVEQGALAGVVPWWRRRRAMIPLAVGGVVALTGAALVVPLALSINGNPVDLDASIPIQYTTDTGVTVSCSYGLYFGDPASRTSGDERAAEFVQQHDWTGIGQRIYEKAMADPYEPGPNDDWEVDNQELRDSFSFNRAVNLLWEEIPADIQANVQSAGATSDCTGQLR
jgi:hypothetical protein